MLKCIWMKYPHKIKEDIPNSSGCIINSVGEYLTNTIFI